MLNILHLAFIWLPVDIWPIIFLVSKVCITVQLMSKKDQQDNYFTTICFIPKKMFIFKSWREHHKAKFICGNEIIIRHDISQWKMYAHSCIPVRLKRVGVCVCVYSHYRPFTMQGFVYIRWSQNLLYLGRYGNFKQNMIREIN